MKINILENIFKILILFVIGVTVIIMTARTIHHLDKNVNILEQAEKCIEQGGDYTIKKEGVQFEEWCNIKEWNGSRAWGNKI